MNWHEYLQPYLQAEGNLFDDAFVARWGEETWNPTDKDAVAAAKLYGQLVSRIATQRLGYLEGVEEAALESIHVLFPQCRRIVDENSPCRHFEAIAWQVLNTHVRPFTAKWHRESRRGTLASLDATDEFRSELFELQSLLQRFQELLVAVRDKRQPREPPRGITSKAEKSRSVDNHQAAVAPDHLLGLADAEIGRQILAAERKFIDARRRHYGIPEKAHTIGLALSGGGIRSATFSLGILVALARRTILPQIDYLSTVSGGGYLGSFLTVFLNSPVGDSKEPRIGLRPSDLPFFREEGEAEALRHIRHHSKYLASRSLWERSKTVSAQIYGMLVNFAGIVFIAAILALFEFFIRHTSVLSGAWAPAGISTGIALLIASFVSPLLLRRGVTAQRVADSAVAGLALVLVALLGWKALGYCHQIARTWSAPKWAALNLRTIITLLGAIPAVASAFSGFAGRKLPRASVFLVVVAAFATPLFLFAVYLSIYGWIEGPAVSVALIPHAPRTLIVAALIVALSVLYFVFLDINFTSPHRYYRNKLATAYLIQPALEPTLAQPFTEAGSVKLSEVNMRDTRGPYHLWNGALNVPSSTNSGMQGRLTDFFLFSPAYCGSPLVGYKETTAWEAADRHLNVGTAMAISGAAAAPQMGLATRASLRFWLALLNVRLGYWVRRPGRKARLGSAPGLWFLFREMLGWMNENSGWVNVSDGGHIENLGVYELLRRRCRYILAVDGEQDQRMTFAALTTLQRLSAIDLGTRIDINLDDLRLNEQGLSRSHFRFCRIYYPGNSYGYLLYLKLSLTGNEGEFIRRYRSEDPAFPHDSTANQFFTEAQFEAYRSLGEHVGDKLFLRAIVGRLADSTNVDIEQWFTVMANNLLEPLRR
jgi:hypothetical protein